MVTLEDLQQQIVDLQEKVAAITDPPTDYYTHLWSGEEIDDAINRSRVGGSIDTALSNKVNVGDAYGVPNQISNDLNIFTVNQTVAFDESTLNRPPDFSYGTATILGNVGWNIGTQIAISTSGQLALRRVDFVSQSFGNWIPYATATPPQEYDLPLSDSVAAYTPCWYFKTQEGIVNVYLNFQATGGISSGGELIATLPVGFRPKTSIEFSAIAFSVGSLIPFTMVINVNGEITSGIVNTPIQSGANCYTCIPSFESGS